MGRAGSRGFPRKREGHSRRMVQLLLRIGDHRLNLIRIAAFGSRGVHCSYDEVVRLTALDRTVSITGSHIQGRIDLRVGAAGHSSTIDVVSNHAARRARVPCQSNTVLRWRSSEAA